LLAQQEAPAPLQQELAQLMNHRLQPPEQPAGPEESEAPAAEAGLEVQLQRSQRARMTVSRRLELQAWNLTAQPPGV
jgi:hypothetical protein